MGPKPVIVLPQCPRDHRFMPPGLTLTIFLSVVFFGGWGGVVHQYSVGIYYGRREQLPGLLEHRPGIPNLELSHSTTPWLGQVCLERRKTKYLAENGREKLGCSFYSPLSPALEAFSRRVDLVHHRVTLVYGVTWIVLGCSHQALCPNARF